MSKLIAKTPIKIEQGMKSETRTSKSRKSQARAAILRWRGGVAQKVGDVSNVATQTATPGGERTVEPTINVAGLSAGGDGVVSKLIAKTPIKIEQELKQANENEQKLEVQAKLALKLAWSTSVILRKRCGS